MRLAQSGEPTLRLLDAEGPRIGLSVTSTGTTGLALIGGGKTRAALSMNADKSAALTIYGADGNPQASVP